MSRVTLRGAGKEYTVQVPEGTSLLELLRAQGIALSAPCGGKGKCGNCRAEWTDEKGTREVLTCQTLVEGDGILTYAPTQGGVIETGGAPAQSGTTHGTGFGAAVDLGTTTVAVQLYDLEKGTCLGTKSDWNRQAAFGADVISRTQYTMEHPDGLARLSTLVREQVEELISALEREAGLAPRSARQVTLSGNTILQHLYAGRSPASIAVAPFTPQTLFDGNEPLEVLGRSVTLTPCVAGYVGGDIVAGLLSAELDGREGCALFLDVGTNGEMALGGRDGLVCCSVASGPAFEGAEISCGMSSQPGAVGHVSFANGRLSLEVIGGGRPRGICGSGLIDLLAILLRTEVVDETGRLLGPEDAPEEMEAFLEEDEDENGIFYLTPDRTLSLRAQDVRKLQLAKAAVAAGIAILLARSGKGVEEIDTLFVAGGFGGGIDPQSAADIGMIPRELAGKIRFLGNSSLTGSAQLLLRPEERARASALAKQCRYLELSGDKAFSDAFIDALLFEQQEE